MATKKTETKKVFTKEVQVGTSKKTGSKFLFIKTKAGKMVFVNLVKDSKRFNPEIKDGIKAIEVEYTSYATKDESGNYTDNMTLFNANIVAHYK